MEYLILGFLTGLSLILAIGAQNIFVIEQGLKKQYVFLVCFVCSISDLILIFLGIFLFEYFGNLFNSSVELILNILLLIFLVHFIYGKISIQKNKISFNKKTKEISISSIITKTLAFTYLNPHVYSDTVFFLGNFSKNFLIIDKYYFGIGASIASFLFFFSIGYLSKLLSKHLQNDQIWKRINLSIIVFMIIIVLYVFIEIFNFF
ncbi:LysE family transporter [Candidatus Pelagibacter sp.]|jgi:L-lysine exporter family protein LysE/ArgO|nr:LysE family transporter [Candidatus Pelagibacter sp.]|tara:strand:- start:767 stop:1381 length:615 start_codon:yes stop_codon:yes gene_type:complete